ncbi:MAG: hypothetical protein JWR61_4639 [Ferruginibacter sp.]|uniref:fibrobacter succinogenes major paralogous domain-containing protein n=1 Tax=Ferruginibacter sp. TaxID=1940288 RepID=UPI0026580C6D|nr:fibrobacter succinogenes major paralogous domain-containing protein [Ferruginibacter sp.]MDB5279684.1 hypothetical protein [Ferruginibacter sp.]
MKKGDSLKAIKIFLFAFNLLAAGTLTAQVGIGILKPAASAQLDVSSTTKGFLPPRMTRAQRNSITSPEGGLTVWCKDCGVLGELQVYNGATWTTMNGDYTTDPIPASVTIGTQEWMTKNLDVVTYRNGDTIPEVSDPVAWAGLTTGAWCYYNNDPANAVYGKLYNRFAVVDQRGLAPLGCHISTIPANSGGGPEDEWGRLQNYWGARPVAELKATTLWNKPNTGATNESGFSALPAGQRNPDGSFENIGNSGTWWSTEMWGLPAIQGVYSKNIYACRLGANIDVISFLAISTNIVVVDSHVTLVTTTYPNDKYGFSVRCIKD